MIQLKFTVYEHLHILLSTTAQISLELHFCVELDNKKALQIAC